MRDMVLRIRESGQCYAATSRRMSALLLREGPSSARQIAVENLCSSKAPV